MSDCHVPSQTFQVFLVKGLAYQPHSGAQPDVLAVANGYTDTLLPAMLKRVQPEKRWPHRVVRPQVNSYYPTLFLRVVILSSYGRCPGAGYLINQANAHASWLRALHPAL